MTLPEILLKAKREKATKVFINPDDVGTVIPFRPFPIDPPEGFDLNCLGKGGGLYWYEDAEVNRGSYRLE